MIQGKPPDLDETGNPVDTKPPDLNDNHEPEEDSDSLIYKAIKWAVSPINKPQTQGGLLDAIKAIPEVGRNFIHEPIETTKNFFRGAGEMTSPADIATAVFSGGEYAAGKAGLTGLAKIASMGVKATGIPVAAHGIYSELDPNASIMERILGGSEIAAGALPFLHIPKTGKLGKIAESVSSPNIDEELAKLETHTPLTAEAQANMGENSVKKKEEIADLTDKTTNDTNKWTMEVPPPDIPGEVIEPSKIIGKVDTTVKPNIRLVPNDPNSIVIKNPEPGVIKQVMEKGYVFDSVMDDGTFKMIKSDKPVNNLPILESEVGQNRPTPSNAARMMDDGSTNIESGPKKLSPLTEAFNFPRAVMASMDFSAPLRQGMTLIHKKAFWTSLDDMFKAWGSEKAYQTIQSDILERPLFKPRMTSKGPIKSFAEEAGLSLTDLKSLSNREENLMSTWAEKVPGVRRSNRAYTVFLNKLRADTFEDLISKSKVLAGPEPNLPLARELANFMNTASGRGSLGKLEKSAVALNTMLFSPRLISSRLTMLNPRYYIMASPQVRKEALKSLFALAAAGNTVTQLGRMAGGTIESDPASSDFGKLKIGNTRLDPFAGFQQYVVAATRLLSGRDVSSTSGKEYNLNNPTGPFDPTRLGVMGSFARSKLHPVLGFAYSLLNGQKEMTGQKMDFTTLNPMDNAVAQRFIPILFQDLYQLAQDDPTLLPIMGTLSTFGMGVQTYGGQQ